MTSFIKYLKEEAEKKKYAFKIKIAGDLPEHCEDTMETALQKYQVSRFTKGKSTPIQSELLEFPNVRNMSMTVFEVELDYPTTSPVLLELISSNCGIDRSCIRVRTPLEEEDLSQAADDKKKTDKPLLAQDYETDKEGQKLVGEKYVSTFLKDIAKTNKETKLKQVKVKDNDKLLAKSSPKGKSEELPKPGPAQSLFAKTNHGDPKGIRK
jgi:hypothetical protein